MHAHVLSKFNDRTSLRGTQNDLIVYEKSMIEHNLVSFYYVGLLEILRAKFKRGLINLPSSPVRYATLFHPNFVDQ